MSKNIGKRWIILTLVVGVLVGGGVAAATILPRKDALFEDPNAREHEPINRLTEAEWETMLQEQVDASNLRFKINVAPSMQEGGQIDLLLESSVSNSLDIQAVVTLDDGRQIYKSPVLPPGGQALYVSLDVELEPGSYPASAVIQAVDPETGEMAGSAQTELTITVKEVGPTPTG